MLCTRPTWTVGAKYDTFTAPESVIFSFPAASTIIKAVSPGGPCQHTTRRLLVLRRPSTRVIMASAASSKKAFIFNDLFDVTAVNPDGKKFDRGPDAALSVAVYSLM